MCFLCILLLPTSECLLCSTCGTVSVSVLDVGLPFATMGLQHCAIHETSGHTCMKHAPSASPSNAIEFNHSFVFHSLPLLLSTLYRSSLLFIHLLGQGLVLTQFSLVIAFFLDGFIQKKKPSALKGEHQPIWMLIQTSVHLFIPVAPFCFRRYARRSVAGYAHLAGLSTIYMRSWCSRPDAGFYGNRFQGSTFRKRCAKQLFTSTIDMCNDFCSQCAFRYALLLGSCCPCVQT